MADPDRFDALVIGAGFSGLAAGIRLAMHGRRVAVLERHYLWGGLNSYYKLGGRRFDVGLHALTNFVPPRTRDTPLSRVLKQLRLRHADLKLGEHRCSEILFPGVRLEFTNELERLESEVERAFPAAIDRFRKLVEDVRAYDLNAGAADERGAKAVLHETLGEPMLAEMLLLPCLYYGSAREHDVDWASYCILFRSIFLEGLSRPEGGVKPVLDLLLARLKDAGGELRMKSGVKRVRTEGERAVGVELDDGTLLDADIVLSSAGWAETMKLAGHEVPGEDVGELSFLETLSVLDRLPEDLGHTAATSFYSLDEEATYRVPDELIEPRSGVISTPNNYAAEEPLTEGLLRLTVSASYPRWTALADDAYVAAKERAADEAIAAVTDFLPDWRPHTTFRDVYTPKTIHRFTWRRNGAVYGARTKRRDGTTPVEGLFLCGTDQGLLGVIGSMVSGIQMANRHGVSGVHA